MNNQHATAESIAEARAAMWAEREQVTALTGLVFGEDGTPYDLQVLNAREALAQGIAGRQLGEAMARLIYGPWKGQA